MDITRTVALLLVMFVAVACHLGPGDRCEYPEYEYRELEDEFYDAWKCVYGLKGINDAHREVLLRDVICYDDFVEARCRTTDGTVTEVCTKLNGCYSLTCPEDQELWIVTGRTTYANEIELVTRDELRQTSYFHEMAHIYHKHAHGDYDVNHKKEPGPWGRETDLMVEMLKKGEFTCSSFSSLLSEDPEQLSQ